VEKPIPGEVQRFGTRKAKPTEKPAGGANRAAHSDLTLFDGLIWFEIAVKHGVSLLHAISKYLKPYRTLINHYE
jgi:hypothetical protein